MSARMEGRRQQGRRGARTGIRRPAVSLARALSKLGFSSRSQAARLIASGRVRVNGVPALDSGLRVDLGRDVINVEGLRPASGAKVYLMLNKPRGLVTTASDEKSRPTVFECFKNTALPRVVPVGRLDMASEGLLLFTNDTRWADHLLDPASCVERVYHVQVEPLPAPDLCQRLTEAIKALDEDRLAARSARVLRTGVRTGWLDIVLDEGKNREIRRLLKACGENVRRLVRVAFGPLRLGNLPNGAWRELTAVELEAVNGALASRGRWPGRARDESRAGRPDPSGPGPARP